MKPGLDKIIRTETDFAVLDLLPIGAFVLREDYVVLYWNRCLEDWTGVRRGDIVGTAITDRFPHLQEPKYSDRINSIFGGGSPAIFSSQLHKYVIPSMVGDGRFRIQHTTVTPLRASDGKGLYALFAIQDFTDISRRIKDYKDVRDRALQEVNERRKAEEALERYKMQLEEQVRNRTEEFTKANVNLQEEIVERMRTEDELRTSERFLSTIFKSIRDPFSLTDRDYRIVWANEDYARMKDMKLEDLIGKKCFKVLQNRKNICKQCVVEKTFISKDPCSKEKLFVFPDGLKGWVEIYTYPIFDEDGEVSHVIEYTRDITDRKRSENERLQLIEVLEHLSKTDSLTGVLNRRALVEALEKEKSRGVRSGDELSLIFCDIDLLKGINDRHGHDMGDKVLRTVAGEINGLLRGADTIGRYGGDEFVIILPETSLKGAAKLAERMRRRVEKLKFSTKGGGSVGVTVSLGVATFNTFEGDVEVLTRRADEALYSSKKEGRNRVFTIE